MPRRYADRQKPNGKSSGGPHFGPTWNHSLEWVSSNYDETYNSSKLKSYGLNEFGKEVISICQDNNVLVD